MKKIVIAASLILCSLSVHAIPTTGFSDVTDNGDGSYTFAFDTLAYEPSPSDIFGNAEGISFSGYGIDLTVTGSGTVIQDIPEHGGLGVNGGAGGDNLAGDEWLNFVFGSSIDLLYITFNGNHTDAVAPDTLVTATTSKGYLTGLVTEYFDGIDPDWDNTLDVLPEAVDITHFMLEPDSFFSGYVESITIKKNSVPEPSLLALLSIGLVGIGLAGRKE